MTVGRVVPSALAIALLLQPSAACKIIRLRNATRCSVLPLRTSRSNFALSSDVTANAALIPAMHHA